LLEELASPLLLPEAVAAEILAGPDDDPARAAVLSGWASRRSSSLVPGSITEWGLGAGESAVLALALELGATAVFDDAAARTAARALGVPLIGTLGVVIRAKRRGLVPSACSVIADLRGAGLYLDDEVVRVTLERIGDK
jgi:predicted nucleic acid-binding protein